LSHLVGCKVAGTCQPWPAQACEHAERATPPQARSSSWMLVVTVEKLWGAALRGEGRAEADQRLSGGLGQIYLRPNPAPLTCGYHDDDGCDCSDRQLRSIHPSAAFDRWFLGGPWLHAHPLSSAPTRSLRANRPPTHPNGVCFKSRLSHSAVTLPPTCFQVDRLSRCETGVRGGGGPECMLHAQKLA
jgi:hypothetical protein